MIEFKYSWLHLSTGKTGESTKRFANEIEFLRQLNRWNFSKDFKYWS